MFCRRLLKYNAELVLLLNVLAKKYELEKRKNLNACEKASCLYIHTQSSKAKTPTFFHPAIPLKNVAPFILYFIHYTVTFNAPEHRIHILWKPIAVSRLHCAGCLEHEYFLSTFAISPHRFRSFGP